MNTNNFYRCNFDAQQLHLASGSNTQTKGIS